MLSTRAPRPEGYDEEEDALDDPWSRRRVGRFRGVYRLRRAWRPGRRHPRCRRRGCFDLDADVDADAGKHAGCKTLFEEHFATGLGAFTPNASGGSLANSNGRLAATVTDLDGGTAAVYGNHELGIADVSHLRLRYVASFGGPTTGHFGILGCTLNLGTDSSERPTAALTVHVEGYLAFDDLIGSSAGDHVVESIDARDHFITLDLTTSNGWITTDAELQYDDARDVAAKSIETAIRPTNVNVRCGVVYLDTGSNPNVNVSIDDVVLESCDP
jgi:hypothetical protein